MNALLQDIKKGGAVAANSDVIGSRASLSSAITLTQAAINGLGSPVFASMTDHAPTDITLAQSQTMYAISASEGKSADANKAPIDRAIAEVLLQKQITAGNTTLNSVEKPSAGLSNEALTQLQADATAEKEALAKARQFGGGCAKTGMTGILAEINENNGLAISVSSLSVAEKGNSFLNQQKTLMEINAMKAEPIFASLNDHKPVDTGLAQAQTMFAISHKAPTSVSKPPPAANRAINEALTMNAITGGRVSLKNSGPAPTTALTAEKLAELQEHAKVEKEEAASVPIRRASIVANLRRASISN